MRTARHMFSLVSGKSKPALALPRLGRHGVRLEIGQTGEAQRSAGPVAEAVSRLKKRASLYQRLAQISEAQHRTRAKATRTDQDGF